MQCRWAIGALLALACAHAPAGRSPGPKSERIQLEGSLVTPSEVLDPRRTWSDKHAYDDTARELTHRFAENFREFEPFVGDEVKEAAVHPRV